MIAKKDIGGFSLTEMQVAVCVGIITALVAAGGLVSMLRVNQYAVNRSDFNGMVSLVQRILKDQTKCASAFKNQSNGAAKFNPIVPPPPADTLSTLQITPSLNLKLNAAFPSTSLTVMELKLSEQDASQRDLATSTYLASLKLSAEPTSGKMLGNKTQTIQFPLWVKTNSASEITACGVAVARATSGTTLNPALLTRERKFFTRNTQFNSAGTFSWTVPTGVQVIEVEAWGAGGGGGGSRWFTDETCGGGGGGGGAYMRATIAVTPGTVHSVQVGAGGAGGHAGNSSADGVANSSNLPNADHGQPGGNSMFGNFLKVGGGPGGRACQYAICSNGQICRLGGAGSTGGCVAVPENCSCTNCLTSHIVVGGKGGAPDYNYTNTLEAAGGSGGSSPLGGPGAPHNYFANTTTTPGIFPGGAGGGGSKYNDTDKSRPGSNGANGRVIIWY